MAGIFYAPGTPIRSEADIEAHTASFSDTGSINDVVETDNAPTTHTDLDNPDEIVPITISSRFASRLPQDKRNSDGTATLFPLLKIGQGSFGAVYRVRVGQKSKTAKGRSGRSLIMAVKIRRPLDKKNMSADAIKRREELRLRYWKVECYCTNILRLRDTTNSLHPYQKYVIQALAADWAENFILMPLYSQNMRAEILDWKESPPYRTQTELDKITVNAGKAVARGIAFIHSKRILHTDIRPENVFVRKMYPTSSTMERPGYPDMVVGDFSSAVHRFNPDTPHTCRITAVYYRCPEAIMGYTNYSWPIDIWGFGIIMWMLCRCNGNSPFKPINSATNPRQDDEIDDTRQGVINAIHYYLHFDERLYVEHIPRRIKIITHSKETKKRDDYVWRVSRHPRGKMFGSDALKVINPSLVRLIMACLDTNPIRRPSIDAIIRRLGKIQPGIK